MTISTEQFHSLLDKVLEFNSHTSEYELTLMVDNDIYNKRRVQLLVYNRYNYDDEVHSCKLYESKCCDSLDKHTYEDMLALIHKYDTSSTGIEEA